MPKRSRGYFRKQRLRNIERRKNLIKECGGIYYFNKVLPDDPEFKDGTLHKGHNGHLSMGRSVKTNTRKGHSTYRHKGAYGPADNYKKHDKQQIEDGNQQIKDWEEEDGKREKESSDCN